MKPYFDINHAAGLLFLVTCMAWGMMELSQRSSQSRAREGATKVGSRGFRIAVALSLAATTAGMYLAPHFAPAAAIRPSAVAFAVGMAILLAGLVLRGLSFKALGEYFTHTVMVSLDQPVIATGPYRVLRHPSYTGILLASIGLGLASANWIGLAVTALPTLALLLGRIHVEERALLAALGERYQAYAAQHKRLVPLIW
jgi:protein-S-isoprenylcysteine O-methyltransferase Ste14